jgi:hypothetical protein
MGKPIVAISMGKPIVASRVSMGKPIVASRVSLLMETLLATGMCNCQGIIAL